MKRNFIDSVYALLQTNEWKEGILVEKTVRIVVLGILAIHFTNGKDKY